MARVTIKVTEAADNDNTRNNNFSVRVSLSSYIDSSAKVESPSQHPCLRWSTTTLTFPNFERLQEEVSWLLEKHLDSEPFSTARADHARHLINEHGIRLKHELGIVEDDLERYKIDEILFNLDDGDHTRTLLWEVLENPGLWNRQLLICTRRIILQIQERRPLKRQPTNPPVQSKLNILLLVARKTNDKIDHQLTSRLLIEMLDARPDLKDRIVLKICRPGSKNALLHALRQNDYDLLHLDLHGDIDEQGYVDLSSLALHDELSRLSWVRPCLLFQSAPSEPPEHVRASDVAAIIIQNRISLVFMNACRSAQLPGNTTQNSLAASLAQSGVSCVVGMSYEISSQAIKIFHQAFYEALLQGGKEVSTAVCLARRALQSQDSRSNAMFGSPVSIHDYLVPVVYYSDGLRPLRSLPYSSPLHSGANNQTVGLETKAPAIMRATPRIGRIAEAFEIENKLLRSGVALLEGPCGIGKRCLMEDLASWLQKSGLVHAIYELDCSGGTLPEERCLDLCLHRHSSIVSNECGSRDRRPDSVMDLLNRDPSILLMFNVDDQPGWVVTVMEELASIGRAQEVLTSFLLISSRRSFAWMTDGLDRTKAENPIFKVGPMDQASSMRLLATKAAPSTPVLSVNACPSATGGNTVCSAPWYHFQVIALLGYNPLALKVASELLVNTDIGNLMWQLQVDKIPLHWASNAKLLQLASNWAPLISRWGSLMLTLLPCQKSISRSLLMALITSMCPHPSKILAELTESLVVADAVYKVGGRSGRYDSFTTLNLHPLLCQYIREQQWNDDDIHRIWLNVATFYHNESLRWISIGIYSKDVIKECRGEWQNLMAMLGYLSFNELELNLPEASLFDLPWLVCSFVALNKAMTKLEKDILVDLTVVALQKLCLDFQVTESYPWQLIFEAGVRRDSSIMSEQQIVRICLTCLHLVQSYYDISEVTARDYNHLLLTMLRTLDFDSFDWDLCNFLRTVLCFCMLISDELDAEDGIGDFGNETSQYISDQELEDSFRTFANTWNQTHVYRGFGYHSKLGKTRSALGSTAIAVSIITTIVRTGD